MSIPTIELAVSEDEAKKQFQRGLALVDTDAIGMSDHTLVDLYRIAQESTAPDHTKRHNKLRERVSNDEIPPIIVRPSGLLQTKFDAIGMNIGRSLVDLTGKEPLAVEEGYFLWYQQAGDCLMPHRDNTSGYGVRIGLPLGGIAVFEAANHRRGILLSPSLILQNLSSPILHGAQNITPGRLVPVWDIETKTN